MNAAEVLYVEASEPDGMKRGGCLKRWNNVGILHPGLRGGMGWVSWHGRSNDQLDNKRQTVKPVMFIPRGIKPNIYSFSAAAATATAIPLQCTAIRKRKRKREKEKESVEGVSHKAPATATVDTLYMGSYEYPLTT